MADMSTPFDRLRAARKRHFSSARQAAAALGLPPSTYAAHENGQNTFDVDDAKRYAAKFKVRWEWLLDDDGPQLDELEYVSDEPRALVKIDDVPTFAPVVPGAVPEIDVRAGAGEGTIGPASPTFALGSGSTYRGHEVVGEWLFPALFLKSELHARIGRTVIIPVRGDSMKPSLEPGDRVIVDTSQNRMSVDGAIYVILDHNGDPQVKRLQVVNDDPVQIRIASDNPSVKDRVVTPDRIAIVGRVVGRVTRL